MIKPDGVIYVPQSVYEPLEDNLQAEWYPDKELYRNQYMERLPFSQLKSLEVRNANNSEDFPIACDFTVDCRISYSVGARGFVVSDLHVNLRPVE